MDTLKSVETFSTVLQKSTNLNAKLKVKDDFCLENFETDSFVSTLITAEAQLFLELKVSNAMS